MSAIHQAWLPLWRPACLICCHPPDLTPPVACALPGMPLPPRCSTYCHGGKLFRCATGTECRGGAGRGLAPCRGTQSTGACALGEYSCLSST
jgi:hypothetical protein